jgi:hypothetical protein
MEHFHRTLKTAIMCHADQHWTEALPFVLLGIRTSFKADHKASVAEFGYGEHFRTPGELLTPTAHPLEPAHLITQLCQQMARLMPVPATRHASPGTSQLRTRFPLTGLNLSGSRATLQRVVNNNTGRINQNTSNMVYYQTTTDLCKNWETIYIHIYILLVTKKPYMTKCYLDTDT